MISTFLKHLRTHGVRRTLRDTLEYANDRRLDWIDAGFDRRYGTDTGGIIDDMGELRVDTENRAHARGYQGIQVPVFRRIVGDLRTNLGVDPTPLHVRRLRLGKGPRRDDGGRAELRRRSRRRAVAPVARRGRAKCCAVSIPQHDRQPDHVALSGRRPSFPSRRVRSSASSTTHSTPP